MLIGELVERTGFTKDTIRFYEKKGLITVDKRSRRANNYKEYPEQVLQKLMLIRKLKDIGFTLNETYTFMERWKDEDASCLNLKHILEEKVQAIAEEIERLAALKSRLTQSLLKCNSNACEFEETVAYVCR